jgi:hypothetical protein
MDYQAEKERVVKTVKENKIAVTINHLAIYDPCL